jgi:hypothetical protein
VVHSAVAVAVFEQFHALGLFQEIRDPLAQMAFHHVEPIVHRAAGEVFIEPVAQTPDVAHAGEMAEGFADVSAAFLVETEADHIGEVRFGGKQVHLQAGRHRKFLDGQFAFIGRRGDLGIIRGL